MVKVRKKEMNKAALGEPEFLYNLFTLFYQHSALFPPKKAGDWPGIGRW